MKKKFSEYYKLNDKEIKEHWKQDIFSFDANVLLNLYRYTPSTRKAFFDLLSKIKDRIWIPYQAAYEYQKNRLSVINAQKEAYKEIRDILEKKKNEIETKLNTFKKHPYLLTNDLKRQIESSFKAISKDLDRFESDHPDYLATDPILDELTMILDDCIGDDFEQQELEKIYKEGKKRYVDEVPPGYKDLKEKKSSPDRSLYGDLIVWKQVVEKAKDITSSVIFVTDDLKDDWWYKFKGRTIGPRPELIKEYRVNTGKRINIYQADRFLEYANKNLELETTKEAIEEVRSVRLADEEDLHEISQKNILSEKEDNNKPNESDNSSFEQKFKEYIIINKEQK